MTVCRRIHITHIEHSVQIPAFFLVFVSFFVERIVLYLVLLHTFIEFLDFCRQSVTFTQQTLLLFRQWHSGSAMRVGEKNREKNKLGMDWYVVNVESSTLISLIATGCFCFSCFLFDLFQFVTHRMHLRLGVLFPEKCRVAFAPCYLYASTVCVRAIIRWNDECNGRTLCLEKKQNE